MMTGQMTSTETLNTCGLVDKVAPNLRAINRLSVKRLVSPCRHVRAHRARVPSSAVLAPRDLLAHRGIQPAFSTGPPARCVPAAFPRPERSPGQACIIHPHGSLLVLIFVILGPLFTILVRPGLLKGINLFVLPLGIIVPTVLIHIVGITMPVVILGLGVFLVHFSLIPNWLTSSLPRQG